MAEFLCRMDRKDMSLVHIHTICRYHFTVGTADARPHSHKHWELGYVSSGTGFFHLNGTTTGISAGDLVLVEPGAVHSEEHAGNSCLNMLFLMFNDSFSPYTSWGVSMKGVRVLGTQCHPEIERMLKTILEEATEQKTGYRHFISAEITRLFLSIHRLACCDAPALPAATTLAETVDYRKARFADELSAHIQASMGIPQNMGDLAERFFYSPQHLARVFKEVTGKTPKEYSEEVRINKAMLLLKNNEEAASIAESLGFSSIQHFYKVFKKITGMTPLSYRLFSNQKLST